MIEVGVRDDDPIELRQIAQRDTRSYVAANRAAVVEAAGEVESNGPVTVDVVPDGRWLLTNPGETTLETVCRKNEETFKLLIQPGDTTILRPESRPPTDG